MRFIHGHRARLQTKDFDLRWKLDRETGCHIWHGLRNEKGYGRSGRRLAHRIAWERVNGMIPDGLEPDHLCRNPSCVNPAHLELVTSAENTRRGLRTKLTAEDVLAIRASAEPPERAGRRYGVAPSTISNIRARRTWRDI